MTPQQQQVVQQFVQQKFRHNNSNVKNYAKKQQPKYQSQEEFYCEICKIACGTPFVSEGRGTQYYN